MFAIAATGVGLAAGLIADADQADAADGGNLKLNHRRPRRRPDGDGYGYGVLG